MSRRKITMNKNLEILRLRHDCGRSIRQVADALGVSTGSVQKTLRAAEQANLSWPIETDAEEQRLMQYLYPQPPASGSDQLVDWAAVNEQLRPKGVTLKLLWQEHQQQDFDYSYSQFCRNFRAWRNSNNLSMRRHYEPGEFAFVDFSGLTVEVADRKAEIFVAALGASSYTFACASWTQNLGDWLNCNTDMLEYFEGCPHVIMPDNLKSAVNRACRYDPDFNGTYQRWADHYGVCVIAARPRKAKDKAIVEKAVQQVQRWVLAPLRDHRFESLSQLNQEMRGLLKQLNDKAFSNRPGSRTEAFETLERPALLALNPMRFELCDIKIATVGFDYHVCYQDHWYSVPHEFFRKKVEIHVSARLVHIYYGSSRIATHPKADSATRAPITNLSHMPEAHAAIAKWNPDSVQQWANQIGEDAGAWVSTRINEAPHFHKVSRLCVGVLSLSNQYSKARLNLACRIANRVGLTRYNDIKQILKDGRGLDLEAKQLTLELPQHHENVRGPKHFK